jgi:hypothetical protein
MAQRNKLPIDQIQKNERKRAAETIVRFLLKYRSTRSYPGYKDLASLANRIKKVGIGGSWGNGFPYFEDVDMAAYEIGNFCRKWGRISVSSTKEKYGSARVYCSFGCQDLHSLVYPGHIHVRGWYALTTFPFFRPLQFIIVPWQLFIYRWGYKRALSKYPYIRNEILCCADYPEYLKGL